MGEKLIEMFGESNVFAEYKDDPRYPYHCDFYIRPLDVFIELNLFFTHGADAKRPPHLFDPDNPSDLQQLAKWKEKAATSNFYKSAIDVWTRRDPEKYATAVKNKLNYVALYTEKSVYEYIEKLKGDFYESQH